jgi:hypothetical protein
MCAQVLVSIMKWCWSRLPGGVVTWETYDLFKQGETGKYRENSIKYFQTLIACARLDNVQERLQRADTVCDRVGSAQEDCS